MIELGSQLRRLDSEKQRAVLATGSWPTEAKDVGHAEAEITELAGYLSRYWSFLELETRPEFPSVVTPLDRLVDARGSRCEVKDLIGGEGRALLSAPAGFGKTFVCTWLAREFANDVHVRPMRFQPRIHHRAEDIERMSERIRSCLPNIVFLFDGLDEIPTASRREAAELIALVVRRIDSAKCLVASRPIPELDVLHDFKTFSLALLNPADVVLAVTAAAGARNQPGGAVELRRFLCHLSERRSLSRECRHPLVLKSAWRLFEQNAITPFSEAEIVGEYVRSLLEGDARKNIVRVREPWASPQSLSSLVAEVSFHLLAAGQDTFTTSDAATWINDRFPTVPIDELLSLLSVLGVVVQSNGRFQMAHKLLRDYFAALRAVESSESAGEYLKDWSGRPEMREVVRLACGITNDASSLLNGVLDASQVDEVERCTLIAEILGQPVTAERSVMDRSCDVVVQWLDGTLRGWFVNDRKVEDFSWELSAEGKSLDALSNQVEHALTAIHRARSGPAYEPLRQRMKQTKSALLPEFADAMALEGRLNVRFQATSLQAMISEPQLI